MLVERKCRAVLIQIIIRGTERAGERLRECVRWVASSRYPRESKDDFFSGRWIETFTWHFLFISPESRRPQQWTMGEFFGSVAVNKHASRERERKSCLGTREPESLAGVCNGCRHGNRRPAEERRKLPFRRLSWESLLIAQGASVFYI